MTELEKRALACVALALPSIPPAELPQATSERFPQWDSLATVSLVSMLEQELSLEIAYEDLASFSSVPALLEYVRRRAR